MPATAPVVTDPFAEDTDGFNNIDFRTGPAHFADQNPEGTPPVVQPVGTAPSLEPEPAPTPAAAAPVVDEPEVTEYDDGSSITIEKAGGKWKATLVGADGARPEVFYGSTKNEMYQNIAVGKINATKKIRELNRKVKLSVAPTPAPQAPEPTPQLRQLTADDIFDIKNKLAADPNLALDTWFQKRTGLNVEQLVGLAQKAAKDSEASKIALEGEAVAREFISRNPDYYADPESNNYSAIVGWLSKHHLRQQLTATNQDKVFSALVRQGYWTAENVQEAFEDLRDDGLLEEAPDDSEQEPAPQPVVRPVAAQPSSDPRIASTRRQPRAGLGIRPGTGTSQATPTEPLPAEGSFEDMTDDQINAQFAAVRQYKLSQGRR